MNEHGFSKNRGVFFFLQKPDPISLSSYTNKLEVEWKYICWVQAIELENTMKINSAAAVLKSPEVSLSLPRAITWGKLPVWFLKCCTMGKKTTCIHWVFVVSDVSYETKLWLHPVSAFPISQLWGNAGKLLLSYLRMEKLAKEGSELGRNLQKSSVAGKVWG